MRILAPLLIQIKAEDPSINNLQDCLNPKYFNTIIKCTKIVTGNDVSKDKYNSPPVILKMGSSDIECCDIAKFQMLTNCENLVMKDTQYLMQEAFNNLRKIIEKQWSYKVSTNACEELYKKNGISWRIYLLYQTSGYLGTI